MIGSILTGIIGTIAKGKAAKAIAAGAAGAALTAGEPIVDAFFKGFANGTIPQIEELGSMLGQAAAGYIAAYALAWFAPANDDSVPAGKMGSPMALVILGVVALVGVGLWAFS